MQILDHLTRVRTRTGMLAPAVTITGIALPLVLGCWFVTRFAVNVPFWDEWELVPLLQRLHSGTLTFQEIFAQHGEHRVFFPTLLMLALAQVTRYNSIAEMYCSLALLSATVFVLVLIHRRVFGSSAVMLLAFVPISWLMFGWRQWENLLWGFQVSFFLLMLCVVVSAFLLSFPTVSPVRVAIAAAAAWVASFSLGAGLLIWPLGLAQLGARALFDRSNTRLWWLTTAWYCCACAAFYMYFHGYVTSPPPWPQGFQYVLQHRTLGIEYALTMAGSALAIDWYTAMAFGILIALLSAASLTVLFRAAGPVARRSEPFLVLIVFATLSGAFILSGRMGMGLSSALSSRYTSIFNLGIVGIYSITLLLAGTGGRVGSWLFGTISGILLVGTLLSYGYWPHQAEPVRVERTLGQIGLQRFELQSDNLLRRVYPVPAVVRERARVLKQLQYSVFATAKPRPRGDRCNISAFSIDAVNGVAKLAGNRFRTNGTSEAEVSGWATDNASHSYAHSAYIQLDNGPDFPILTGLARPDVAAALHDSKFANSGFLGVLPAGVLSEGNHELSLKIVSDSDGLYCVSPPIRLTVGR